MKFYLPIAITLLFISVNLKAQHANLGVKAGYNLYDTNNENNIKDNLLSGYNIGLVWHTHLSSQFAFQPEIVYSQQGTRSKVNAIETKLKLDYVNVPLIFQFMFNHGFRIEAGPQLGILVDAKSETNGVTAKVKNNFKAIDFAFGGGLGYIKPSTGFGFNLRYNYGLNNVRAVGTAKAYNSGFQMSFFYLFNHK